MTADLVILVCCGLGVFTSGFGLGVRWREKHPGDEKRRAGRPCCDQSVRARR